MRVRINTNQFKVNQISVEKKSIEMYVDGKLERVGVTNHFRERMIEKLWGMNIEQLELLLRNGNIISYNPSIDSLPNNINQQTINNIKNKHIWYNRDIRFYLIPSEDIVLCITPNNCIKDNNDRTKQYQKWCLTTIWKNPMGIFNEELREKQYVKIGGRTIYLN